MNKSQALRPDFLLANLPEEIKSVGTEPTDEEKHLYSLSKHKGWEILAEHINFKLKELDDLNRKAIATGMSFEQVGFNSVVLSGVKDLVDTVFAKVKDAVEACEKPDGTEK